MKQVIGLTSTYSSDEFGICSALFELGGMVVMHDASGCNSTYTTHDEPRWYDTESMIYISAISEMEAILGDDDKFIKDLIDTATHLHPKFIALIGAPIPYMIGTDLPAIANVVEEATGIPCMGFNANGMNNYTKGGSMAFLELIKRFDDPETEKTTQPSFNILGATPLDFSVNGSVESIKDWLQAQGYEVNCCLSMGCSMEDVKNISAAHANLVVSYTGLAAARYLLKEYGTPYYIGLPFGDLDPLLVSDTTAEAAPKTLVSDTSAAKVVIIGESVSAVSLAKALELAYGVRTKVACPLDTDPELLREQDVYAPEEDDIIREIEQADVVIADPLYRSLIYGPQRFIDWPHEAFSGRIYDKANPNLIGDGFKRYFGESLC